MRWLTAFRSVIRNGVESPDLDVDHAVDQVLAPDSRLSAETLGIVPLEGHSELTGQELASAGASLAVPSALQTIEDMHHARERAEVFIERAAADVCQRHLCVDYWDLQSAEVDADEEVATLGAEMDRIGHVEGAAIIGWVIRNAAIRAQRPIASLARGAEKVSGDALALAETLLGTVQRLDPTLGGFVFSLRPRRGRGLRFRDRFGHLWVYGD